MRKQERAGALIEPTSSTASRLKSCPPCRWYRRHKKRPSSRKTSSLLDKNMVEAVGIEPFAYDLNILIYKDYFLQK
jgi:hypothetical protein